MTLKQKIEVLNKLADIIDNIDRNTGYVQKALHYTDEEKEDKLFANTKVRELIEKLAEGI